MGLLMYREQVKVDKLKASRKAAVQPADPTRAQRSSIRRERARQTNPDHTRALAGDGVSLSARELNAVRISPHMRRRQPTWAQSHHRNAPFHSTAPGVHYSLPNQSGLHARAPAQHDDLRNTESSGRQRLPVVFQETIETRSQPPSASGLRHEVRLDDDTVTTADAMHAQPSVTQSARFAPAYRFEYLDVNALGLSSSRAERPAASSAVPPQSRTSTGRRSPRMIMLGPDTPDPFTMSPSPEAQSAPSIRIDRADGLGDRRRSVSSDLEEPWDTLRNTLRPDVQAPGDASPSPSQSIGTMTRSTSGPSTDGLAFLRNSSSPQDSLSSGASTLLTTHLPGNALQAAQIALAQLEYDEICHERDPDTFAPSALQTPLPPAIQRLLPRPIGMSPVSADATMTTTNGADAPDYPENYESAPSEISLSPTSMGMLRRRWGVLSREIEIACRTPGLSEYEMQVVSGVADLLVPIGLDLANSAASFRTEASRALQRQFADMEVQAHEALNLVSRLNRLAEASGMHEQPGRANGSAANAFRARSASTDANTSPNPDNSSSRWRSDRHADLQHMRDIAARYERHEDVPSELWARAGLGPWVTESGRTSRDASVVPGSALSDNWPTFD